MDEWMFMVIYGCYTPGHGMRYDEQELHGGSVWNGQEEHKIAGTSLGVRMEVLRSLWEGWSR
jgi:hypothetical protein